MKSVFFIRCFNIPFYSSIFSHIRMHYVFFIMLIFPVFCNTFLSVFHYFEVYLATFHANSISQPHNLISSLRRKWNKKAEAICSAPLEMPLFRHRLLSLYILSHFRLRSKV